MDYLADFEQVTTTQQRDGLIVAGGIAIREARTFRREASPLFQGVRVRAAGIVRPIQVGANQFINSDPLPFATAEDQVVAAGTFRVFMSDGFTQIARAGEGFIQLSLTRGQVITSAASVPVASLIVGGGFGTAGDSSLLRVRWNAEADPTTPTTPVTPTPDPAPDPIDDSGGTATNATRLTWLQAKFLAQRGFKIRPAGVVDRYFEYAAGKGLWQLQLQNAVTSVLTTRDIVKAAEFREEDFRRTDWLCLGRVPDALLAEARAIIFTYP